MRRNVYLHFMNRDGRDILGLFDTLTPQAHRKTISRALNVATILCEQNTVMPPGFFLECELAYDVVSGKKPLIDAGLIILPRRELSLEKLIEKKRSEYASVRKKFEGLFDDKRVRIFSDSEPLFVKRKTKIGLAATKKWEEGPDLTAKWDTLKKLLSPEAVENARRAPRLLLENGEALTWAGLQPHLSPEVLHNEDQIRLFLQRDYFTLYVDEFDLVVLREIPQFLDEFYLPSFGYQYSFNHLRNAFAHLGIEWMLDISAVNLARLKTNAKFICFTDCFVQVAHISGSLTNMISLLGRASKNARFPSFRAPKLSLEQPFFPEVTISDVDELTLTDALGDVADCLVREHDLYIRDPDQASQQPGAETGFTPWRNTLAIRNSERRRASRMRTIKNAVLATANARESGAVIDTLKTYLPQGAPTPSFIGRETRVPRSTVELPTKHGKVTVSVTQADETGGDEAAELLRRLVDEVNPDAVFFVGCAALLDEKEQPQKNVVYLARRGIDSDKVTLKSDERDYDMEQHHGDLLIRRTITNLAPTGVFDPITVICNRDFISGSAFLGDRNAQRRKDLVTKFPGDAVVLEMEAFMVFKELFRMRSEGFGPSVSVVKGISDVGDEGARVNKAETQRVAAGNAASVVIKFLLETAG
jgi:nucleoside phosphorylase